jgi:hypothetical protein
MRVLQINRHANATQHMRCMRTSRLLRVCDARHHAPGMEVKGDVHLFQPASAHEHSDPENRQDNVVRIRSGKDKPAAAFTAMHYRNYWFWIDDGDWRTKRAIRAIMFFFTLAETGGRDKLPLITIPAQ